MEICNRSLSRLYKCVMELYDKILILKKAYKTILLFNIINILFVFFFCVVLFNLFSFAAVFAILSLAKPKQTLYHTEELL